MIIIPDSPRADLNRQYLAPNASLIGTFTAASHNDAMTIPQRLMGWEEYKPIEGFEDEPYPDDWAIDSPPGDRRT